ncbi:hypothetical protein LCGC14_0861430 [marine sediment metagenome]|uniref:Calcineurin-like phosphoesterase domain-containing protein n=1 Tax=marine sediment metagenome TaxID=412755 RepID=A0A0F9PC70_9ZZZZ
MTQKETKLGAELRWFGQILSQDLTEVLILILSDLHYGNPFCSVKHFDRTLKFIHDTPNCYALCNGDLCESTIKSSKGDIFSQVGTPQDQRDWVIERLLPIKDKILGMTTGNHEERIYRDAGIDITKDIAAALGVPYRPEGMLHKLSFGNYNNRTKDAPFVFWGYISHGYGGARTKSAKAVKAERTSTWIHADYYGMSHDHVVNVAPDIYLMPDNRGTVGKDGFLTGRVRAHREMLVKTNAYVRWGGYAEALGFPPSDLTTPIIYLMTPKSPMWDLFPDKARRAVKVAV